MIPATTLARVRRFALPGVLLVLGACATGQPEAAPPTSAKPAEISNEFTAAAQVVAVAPAERRVTLRREDGSQFEVVCGESVRNFAQIKVGNTLRVRYRETLAASLCEPGARIDEVQGAILAARARPGEKPGAGAGAAISLRVKIESIDLAREIVTFSLGSGELVARRIQTPQGREFIRGLKIGDIVQLDVTSALALTIEEM